METVFHWQRTWNRVVVRPDDLRAFQHRIVASIDEAVEGTRWEMFSWESSLSAAGRGDVEDLILEVRARHRSMLSLDIRIARTTEGMTLFDLLNLPCHQPEIPVPGSEQSGPPVCVTLNVSSGNPGAAIEVLAPGPLYGDSIVSSLEPQIERVSRRAPSSEAIGFTVMAAGCLVPDLLLARGVIGPELALPLVLICGGGGVLAAIRLMDWLFPPMELLPTDHALSRWQRAWRLLGTLGGVVVGATSIAALIVSLH